MNTRSGGINVKPASSGSVKLTMIKPRKKTGTKHNANQDHFSPLLNAKMEIAIRKIATPRSDKPPLLK